MLRSNLYHIGSNSCHSYVHDHRTASHRTLKTPHMVPKLSILSVCISVCIAGGFE